jgi:hypothetical protein
VSPSLLFIPASRSAPILNGASRARNGAGETRQKVIRRIACGPVTGICQETTLRIWGSILAGRSGMLFGYPRMMGATI